MVEAGDELAAGVMAGAEEAVGAETGVVSAGGARVGTALVIGTGEGALTGVVAAGAMVEVVVPLVLVTGGCSETGAVAGAVVGTWVAGTVGARWVITTT